MVCAKFKVISQLNNKLWTYQISQDWNLSCIENEYPTLLKPPDIHLQWLWHPSTPCQYDEHTSKVKSTTGTKCATLNCRSMNNKEDSIYELIVDNHIDFLALTETWCNSNSTVSLGHITPAGYSVIHTDRPTTFEHQTVSLQHGTNTLHVTTVYVPSGTFSSDFNYQFSELTGVLLSLSGKHVIVGDFNFRINEPADVNSAKCKALIEQFNLIQHFNLSTHVAGNTLDLILTCDDVSVTHIHTDHSVNSDHCAVLFHLSCVSPGTVRKSIT